MIIRSKTVVRQKNLPWKVPSNASSKVTKVPLTLNLQQSIGLAVASTDHSHDKSRSRPKERNWTQIVKRQSSEMRVSKQEDVRRCICADQQRPCVDWCAVEPHTPTKKSLKCVYTREKGGESACAPKRAGVSIRLRHFIAAQRGRKLQPMQVALLQSILTLWKATQGYFTRQHRTTDDSLSHQEEHTRN